MKESEIINVVTETAQDLYDAGVMSDSELEEIVDANLKDAIDSTIKANQKISAALTELEKTC